MAKVGKGCLIVLGVLFLLGLALASLAVVGCIAVGIGLWFFIRLCWRKLVGSSPDSRLVRTGMAIPPFVRKILAGVLCSFISLCLIGAVGSSSSSKSNKAVDNEMPSIEQQASIDEAQTNQKEEESGQRTQIPTTLSAPISFDYSQVPAYDGAASVQCNANVPYFTKDDIQFAKSNLSAEFYGDLDRLGRCTVAVASVGKESMPSEDEKRGEIEQIQPSGWHSVEYDSVPDKYLYNRCHLIGWQLTGENANPNNLITGTYALNVEGMLKYEDDVAAYVKSTGNHVLYRVTPFYVDSDLVARGVLMEAYSLEDDGAGLQFCVWAYNAQPGITLNYADGSSEQTPLLPAVEEQVAPETEAEPVVEAPAPAPSPEEQLHSYVLNTNTKKFHLPGCRSVKKMKEANRQDVEETRSDVISQGYEPCQICNP